MRHLYYLCYTVSSCILCSSTFTGFQTPMLVFNLAAQSWWQNVGQFSVYKSSNSPMIYTYFTNDSGRVLIYLSSSTARASIGLL